MVRLATVGMRRLLLRTASFNAVYQKLAEQGGEAEVELRRKVKAPKGFAGLELKGTGFATWADLVEACDQSGWALDPEALDRPLFPAVDPVTGYFRIGTRESFEVQQLGR